MLDPCVSAWIICARLARGTEHMLCIVGGKSAPCNARTRIYSEYKRNCSTLDACSQPHALIQHYLGCQQAVKRIGHAQL